LFINSSAFICGFRFLFCIFLFKGTIKLICI
jgi:hypothetical protein